jgi:hypothetical protein
MMRVLEILVAVLRKIVPENLRVLKKIWGLKRFFRGESKNNKLKFSWFLDFPIFVPLRFYRWVLRLRFLET